MQLDMLPEKIKFTTEDIIYAEKILLPAGKHFDTERRDFIRNLDTIDLQAVPGSGKTTALLAKLLILERYLPFEDGSGILILSHTNAAIDEIKEKIEKYCPKLFSYPNFIGTIQSFVDQYLAIPFYANKYKKRPFRIDNEIYYEKVEKHLKRNITGFVFQENKNAKYFLIGKKCASTFRFSYHNGRILLIDEINGRPLNIEKPRRGRLWTDFSDGEKQRIKDWLINFKLKIFKEEGVMHFDDAYFLADAYLHKSPQTKKLLQKRFRMVFVDEMQDMDTHQHNLLEKLFYKKHILRHCYQRIGDKNQAIHNNATAFDCWIDREKILFLKGSHRLSKRNADTIKYFGLSDQDVIGLNDNTNIKPHIIVYDDPEEVLPKFTELISAMDLSDEKHPFMAIGWTTHKTEEELQSEKVRIQDYHKSYERTSLKSKIDYQTLLSYLLFYDKRSKSLASIRKNILNAFLKILRLESKKDENERNYNISKLLQYIKLEFPQKYEELKANIFDWSIEVVKGNHLQVRDSIKEYLTGFLNDVFGIQLFANPATQVFIDSDIDPQDSLHIQVEDQDDNRNIHASNDVEVLIGTIHSVKGKTLTAVLYLETFYQGHGSYESIRLLSQFKGEKFSESRNTGKSYHEQSTKMVYVGFSRPTHLLCFAVQRNRFDECLSDINVDTFEII